MLIPNLGNAFGIGNLNRITIVYSDDAGRCAVFTANKTAQMGHTIIVAVAWLAILRHMAVIQAILAGSIFINPLRTVLQPQIYFTGVVSINWSSIRIILIAVFIIRICLYQALGHIGIVNNALPGGIRCSQSKINTTVLINIRGMSIFRALHGHNVADNFNLALLRFHILYININCAAVACQRIVRLDEFTKAFDRIFFSVRSNDTGRIAYQRNGSQVIRMYTFSGIICTYIDSSTAYSNVYVTINSNIATCIANAESTGLPACAGIIGVIAIIHGNCTARTYITMHIFGNNAPGIGRIILAHFNVTVNNQISTVSNGNTHRGIVRGGSNIQITVDSNLTAASYKTIHTSIGIPLVVGLINVKRTFATICAYVIKDVAVFVTLRGCNTIIILYRKRVVLTLEIIGNSVSSFVELYRIAIVSEDIKIIIDNTSKRISIFCSKNRRYEKARCTGRQKNT